MSDFYALVPAAGLGARMGHELPKQYLPLAGRPMIAHALDTLCSSPEISTVFVVLAPDDEQFKSHDWSRFGDKLEPLYCGGEMRSDTVLNGLIASEIEPDDWVLVHDAARPCLSQGLLARLINELRDDAVGGILAVPVADTLKRADDEGRIASTEDRTGLWQAQTPQMFRAGLLTQGLQQCKIRRRDDATGNSASDGRPSLCSVTDEASAVEALGLRPKLVLSESSNFKVTYPRDLVLAELLLTQRGKRR